MIETRWRRAIREMAGVAARFRKDAAGNTIAIVAAALIPLTALIGSGVDMSRAYMAKQKLQQACDAGALAGRRVMTNDNLDDTVKGEVNKFVNFNFPQATYQTASFTTGVTHPDKGIVQVAVSTTIPMTVMKMFGFTTLPLNVTCNASQNFVNTDVMLVLDVTGSMNDYVGGAKKIDSLRSAVLALYDQLKPVQDQLASNGMRLRYGIVPYSQGVNVGRAIYDENPAYLADSWSYYSRKPAWLSQATDSNSCNNAFIVYPTVKGIRYNWPTPGVCSGYLTVSYEQQTIDTSKYKTFAAVDIAPIVGNDARYAPAGGSGIVDGIDYRYYGARNTTWAGCVEERQTVNTITASSGYEIPDDARDLDIDLIPTSDPATKWKPLWPEVEYKANGQRASAVCPPAAQRLQVMSRDQLSTYLNGLSANGSTYHDFGMIWGARFISPYGIFKSVNPSNPASNDPDNPTTYNGMPVNRFLIFMTDGLPDPDPDVYGTYGQERLDKRITGGYTTEADQVARHQQRFKMVCNATKGENVSIWVVGFSTTLDATLKSCASNDSQASTSANQQELIDKFVEIGKNIGALRLAK